jgi:hypothetical protein
MSTRRVVKIIENCFQCSSNDHSGGMTKGGAYPLCRAMKPVKGDLYGSRTLPWKTIKVNHLDIPVADDDPVGRQKRVGTGVIPDWCPLEVAP